MKSGLVSAEAGVARLTQNRLCLGIVPGSVEKDLYV